MVQLTGLSMSFGGQEILKNCSVFIKAGMRAALCGTNGCGKSTLLKIIAGLIQADSGERTVSKDERIAYLPQSGIVHGGRTLAEEAREVFYRAKSLQSELTENNPAREAEETEEALIPRKISAVLTGLGFNKEDFERKTGEFSGGWQMRIALAKVLLEEPGVLLLDEPTNYLDIEGRSWLENYLANFPGAFLLVSHDSYFLDVTTNEIYELFLGKLTKYEGNYSDYQKKRQTELESLVSRYKAQQDEIKKNEDLIRRFRYKATKAAFVQERIKKLEKMERIELPPALKTISPVLPQPPHSGKIAFSLNGAAKRYGSRLALSELDLTVESGERLLVVGPNGAGKTTLLRIIAGADRDFTGSLRYGAGIRAGYWTQDSAEIIAGNISVLDFIEDAAQNAMRETTRRSAAGAPSACTEQPRKMPEIRDILGSFLFRGDDVHKSLDVLSGGEKARLALLKLLIFPLNLLILDEPTNHLDLYSKEALLAALSKWKGTIVFVSHDRAFMEALSTKTLELQNGKPRLYYGNYAYYLEKRGREREDGGGPLETRQKAAREETPVTGQKRNREEQKRLETEKRRQERRQDKLFEKIENLEAEKALLEAELSKPEVYSVREKAKSVQSRIEELAQEIEKTWTLLT